MSLGMLYRTGVQSSSSDPSVLIVALVARDRDGISCLVSSLCEQRFSRLVFGLSPFTLWMMFSIRDETLITNSRLSSPSAIIWLYLSAEFIIGVVISIFLTVLTVIKSVLPKPPRDLTGDVVLIAGASSTLGELLAEEFVKDGCSVICVDNDLRPVEEMASQLRSRYPTIEEIGGSHRKQNPSKAIPMIVAYECNLLNREDIRNTARKVKDDMGGIDVLVTCAGSPNQDIFDTANTTLMSHFWTVMAFLPCLLHREKAYVVGITPIASDQDAYLGSRAAIAGLMESLNQELSNHDSHFTFLAVSPTTDLNLMRQSEQQVAKDIVQAIKRDQCSLTTSWSSRVLYQISCAIYGAITTVTQWFHTQGCDHSF